MATATRTSETKTVKRMVETEITETSRTVTLVLTPDEALTLSLIMSAVGGDPGQSRRQHADNVQRALRGLEIDGLDQLPEGVRKVDGTLFFHQDDRLPNFGQGGGVFVKGARVKRVTDAHWYKDGDYTHDYGNTECRKGSVGTVTSLGYTEWDDESSPVNRASVDWDNGGSSCIALECLQVIS